MQPGKTTNPVAPSSPDWDEALLQALPVIPLRDLVLFPGTSIPLLLGRPLSLSSLTRALEQSSPLAFFALQNNPRDEEITPETIRATGAVGRILGTTALPNGLCKALVEVLAVGRALSWREENGLRAQVELQSFSASPSSEARRLLEWTETAFAEYVQQNPELPRDLVDLTLALPGPLEKTYGMVAHLRLPVELRQSLLEAPTLAGKLRLAREFLCNAVQAGGAARRMEQEVRAAVAQSQKEFFLTEQMRKIQSELGSKPPAVNPEIRKLEEELRAQGLPEAAFERVASEVRRLDYLHATSPEYAVVRTYVDWFLALPWKRMNPDRLDLAKVKAQLDADHFGLREVKDRILEHVAVIRLARDLAAPILCLVGPPGVGKTSLGRSVAKALSREFVRISLGGVRDEAEIRGHRRTYIGSMPGRIVQALKKSGSMNPVILLDEIDKMGGDFRGDPASALLEALDPEQNREFVDHFLEVGVDLSRVFFITTANVEEKIPPMLHDRLEMIRLSGYYDGEKLAIARRHLLPKIRAACGLIEGQFRFSDAVLQTVIRRYTHEAGVRQLNRQLAKLARKRARQIVGGKTFRDFDARGLQAFLGLPARPERPLPAAYQPGMVTALAWTPAGGETLRVECALLSGKGKLLLTGQLGDVMKESAQLALTLARERARRFGVDPADFHKTDVHLHLPEGAISKDGPSAGVALLLALVSAMTRKPVDPRLAFTGEISLAGKIHAVGGLPEKTVAALQAGITRVCVPRENAPEIRELPAAAKRGLKILSVDHVDQALRLVFGSPRPASRKRSG